MADFADVKLFIPGIGHVLYADVDTEEMDLTAFKFGDETTYGDWTWLGDTSEENTIEFSADGGDATQKNTWDRDGVRTIYAAQTLSGTINSVNIAKETFDLAFSGGTYDPAKKKYTVINKKVAVKKAIMIVCEDGQDVMGFRFPNTGVSGTLPSFDVENFLEIPLDVQILSSDSDGSSFDIFEPRPYAAASGGEG